MKLIWIIDIEVEMFV